MRERGKNLWIEAEERPDGIEISLQDDGLELPWNTSPTFSTHFTASTNPAPGLWVAPGPADLRGEFQRRAEIRDHVIA